MHAKCTQQCMQNVSSCVHVHTDQSCWIKLKSDCIYHFQIDLELNGRLFGSKLFRKWWIQSDFGLIKPNRKDYLEIISLCVPKTFVHWSYTLEKKVCNTFILLIDIFVDCNLYKGTNLRGYQCLVWKRYFQCKISFNVTVSVSCCIAVHTEKSY